MKDEIKNKGKVLLFVIFSFILLILPAVALTNDEFPSYQQWTDVDLRHTVAFNGTIDSVTANISVYSPSNEILVSFQPMQKNAAVGDFNYTVPSGKNGVIGAYPYTICGYSALATSSCESFQYEITPNGDKGLLGYYFLIIVLSYGVLALGILKHDVTISILGTFGLFILGLWVLQFGLDIFKNYLTNSFALITLGIAFYMSARMAHEYIEI